MVQMSMVEAEVTVTADTGDALVNTDLANAPGVGAVAIWMASTVADTLATVTVGVKVLKNNSLIGKVATNAQIDVNAEGPLLLQVRGNEKIRVQVDVVTAATVRVRAVFQGVA